MIQAKWEDFSVYLFFEKKLDRSCTPDYLSRFRCLLRFFENRDFNRQNVNLFFATLQSQGKRNQTLNNYLKVLKHLVHFLNYTWLDDYTYFKKQEVTYRIVTSEEIKKLIAVYIEYGQGCNSLEVNRRYQIAISTLFQTGLRIGELCSLRWDKNDVQPDRITVRAEVAKTDKRREVYITEKLYKEICSLPQNEFVFGCRGKPMDDNTFNKELKKRAKYLKLKDWESISPHTLRHAFAHDAVVRRRMPVEVVSHILGHSSMDITYNTYCHHDLESQKIVVETNPLAVDGMTFDRVRGMIEDLGNLINCTHFPLRIERGKDIIILQVQDIK